ncbi:MAG: TIGR03663 family protein [Candidatus Methylacidiphilales bacterium]|nr:TIGR03663 family protein [Candidatus Methylacidiphilales bacterium]
MDNTLNPTPPHSASRPAWRVGLSGFVFLFLALVLSAFSLRLLRIENRPFHTDEAVNAQLLEDLNREGVFHYRANDHHGPLLFYVTAPLLRIAGITRTDDMQAWMLRIVPVLAGTALVAAAALFRPWLGTPAALATAALLALAAPFVYYSGIFIHETLLVLLLLCWISMVWRWRQTGSVFTAALAGWITGLMLATKETAAPILILGGLALLPGTRLPPTTWFRGAAAALVLAFLTTLLLYSDFGRQPDQAFALLDAVTHQWGRATGTDHAHPWSTYLSWMFLPSPIGFPWSSWIMVAGLITAFPCLRHDPLPRALTLFALLLLLFFSTLPYKTPWLQLAFWLPALPVAALGWSLLLHRHPRVAWTAAALALVLMGLETSSRCLRFDADPRNPLAYSPSSPDLERLQRDLAVLAHKPTAPNGQTKPGEFIIQVIAPDYWPLPWTLRHHPNTGFWNTPPTTLLPGLVLAAPEFLGALDLVPPLTPYEIRPGLTLFLGRSPSSTSPPLP